MTGALDAEKTVNDDPDGPAITLSVQTQSVDAGSPMVASPCSPARQRWQVPHVTQMTINIMAIIAPYDTSG